MVEAIYDPREFPVGVPSDYRVFRVTIPFGTDRYGFTLGETIAHSNGVHWADHSRIHWPAVNAVGLPVTLTHDGEAFVLENPSSGPDSPLPCSVVVSWAPPPFVHS